MKAGTIRQDKLFPCRRRIKVPFFQRTYVWGEDEWDRFLDSMIEIDESDEECFMGCLILKQEETSAAEPIGDIRTLIDGQQRLTTLLIFMWVLYKKFYGGDAQEKYEKDFFNAEGEPILLHNDIDIDCFEAIVSGRAEEIRSKYMQKTKYLNRILEAFDYFDDERMKDFTGKKLLMTSRANFILLFWN